MASRCRKSRHLRLNDACLNRMEKLLLLTSSFFVFFLLQSILRLVHDVTLPSSSKDVNQTIIILEFRSKIVREQNTYERYDGKPW